MFLAEWWNSLSLALQILDYVDNRKELPAPSECNENVVYIHV